MIVVIPCRGKGSRVRPYRADGNKLLIDVAGKPAIVRQLEMLKDYANEVFIETLPEFVDAENHEQ